MQVSTIREVSQAYGVSTRTLRYYEEVGLIHSVRQPGQLIRAYDGEALRRLKQILVLRALRLPLKHIQTILADGTLAESLALLEKHAQAIAYERETLGMIQDALAECIGHLKTTGQLHAPTAVLDESTARKLVRALAVPIPSIIKEEPTMPTLTDVRILYLPPATVCASLGKGPNAEDIASRLLDKFIEDRNLAVIKPDFRVYGFNHPNGQKPDGSDHGYEFWVTIPDDMEVEAPYTKQRFGGGLYAAHMIPIGAFEEWGWIVDWVNGSDEYAPRWGDADRMAGLLEEHLNYLNLYNVPGAERKRMQLDLLVPIQPKK